MIGNRAEKATETNAYINGRSLFGLSAKEFHKKFCDISLKGHIIDRSFRRWVASFRARRGQPKDVVCPGRLRRLITIKKRGEDKIKLDILKDDARLTVREMAQLSNILLAEVHETLIKHLIGRKKRTKTSYCRKTKGRPVCKWQNNFFKCIPCMIRRRLQM